MNHDDILRDALNYHAESRPDAADILAAARARAGRRPTMTSSLTAVGAAAAVVAVSVTASALTGSSGGGSPVPAGGSPAPTTPPNCPALRYRPFATASAGALTGQPTAAQASSPTDSLPYCPFPTRTP
jgi:hypothetical protein